MRDLRTYIAAAGSGGALLCAIVLAFGALAGLVAFDGFPSGTDAARDGSVVVQASAERQRAGTPAAVPASAPSSPAAGPPRQGAGASGSQPPANVPAPGGPQQPAGPDQPGPTDPVAPHGGDGPTSPPPTSPEPPGAPDTLPPATPAPGGDRTVGGLVDGVDHTVAAATGIDPGLGPATDQLTAPVDETIDHVAGGLGLGAPAAAGSATPPAG